MSDLLYFSRIQFVAGGADPGAWNPYRAHSFLWRFFEKDPDRKRDFLYRFDLEANRPRYYVVSLREPIVEKPAWRIDRKEFSPKLKSGDQLRFMLRANPVKTTRTRSEQRGKRHDVIMARKKDMGPDWKKQTTEVELLQERGTDWLARRADLHGFAFRADQIRVEGYRKHLFTKRKDGREIRLSTVDFHGTLTVTEPDLFRQTLFNGIGPGKAFGCGMILVRRP